MKKISQLKIVKQLLQLEKHYLKSLSKDRSNAGEYPYLKDLVTQLNLTKGFVVDMAASDGVSQPVLWGFLKTPIGQG